jgi:hypothetical protein
MQRLFVQADKGLAIVALHHGIAGIRYRSVAGGTGRELEPELAGDGISLRLEGRKVSGQIVVVGMVFVAEWIPRKVGRNLERVGEDAARPKGAGKL